MALQSLPGYDYLAKCLSADGRCLFGRDYQFQLVLRGILQRGKAWYGWGTLVLCLLGALSFFNPVVTFAANPVKRGQKFSQISAANLLLEANRLAARRQYAAAINKYKEAVKRDPKNPSVYHMYGRTLALMGLVGDACEQYEIALRYAPKNAEIWTDLGVALVVNGQAGKGALRLKKAIDLNPRFVSAHNNLGATLTQLGDYRAAAEEFELSLRLQPKNPAIQRKLEKVQLRMAETVPFDFNAPDAEKRIAKTTEETGDANTTPNTALTDIQSEQARRAAEERLKDKNR